MTTTSDSQRWASVVAAARGAAEATSAQEFTAGVLPHLARAFDTSILGWYQLGAAGVEGHVGPGMPDAFASYAEYAPVDPFADLKRRLNPRLAIVSEMVDAGTLRRSRVMAEFYPRFDAFHHLVARLGATPFGSPGATGLILSRSRRQAPFRRAHLDMLAEVLPLLERSVARAGASWIPATLSGLLGGVDCGAIAAFDGSARLLWASPRAEGLLARHLGKRRVLPAPLVEAIVRLGALAVGRLPRATDLELEVRGRLRVSLRLARLPEGGPRLVVAQLRSPAGDLEPCARSLGLTAAESAVAAALARGLGNEGIARQLFISPHTVRTHLRHIFDKLGVHTRVDAILALQRAAAAR